MSGETGAGANDLTHLDASGRVRMVDVGGKPETAREAVARGCVRMGEGTLRRVLAGDVPKGDVLATARVAGIMAAKQTAFLVPLCHPIRTTAVEVDVVPDPALPGLRLEARVRTVDRTGAEMEAMTAVAVAALTVYDMCKGIEPGMVIDAVRLVRKTGGKSGAYRRPGEDEWPGVAMKKVPSEGDTRSQEEISGLHVAQSP
ncbi:MAG: cyclic pyranopterin monophosphate synthase MoaC [Clostridia bacterium]|nr:cyclic pyranopterin monophosphate synthase MoaC [Clostridia bacterium]